MNRAFVVALVIAPSLAHADPVRVATAAFDEGVPPPMPAPDGPPGLAPVVIVVPPPGVAVDQPPAPPLTTIAAQSAIASSQRNLMTGTALTVPQGRVEIAGRSAIVVNGVSIAGGLTSTTELWADIYGVIDEDASVYGAGIKQVLARGSNWQLAATASIRGGSDGGSDEKIGLVGGLLTACTERCTVMATGGVAVLFADSDEAIPYYSAAISVGAPTVRLIGELVSAKDGDEFESLGFLGVRFGSAKYSVDMGLATALQEYDDTVVPMLSIAGRM